MNRFELEPSRFLPKIVFDNETGLFSITGKSLPENTTLIYTPAIDWLIEYFKAPKAKTVLEFKMDYFNTATCKVFLVLLEIFETAASNGDDVFINWYYTADDEEMRDAGEELLEIVTVPYSLIEKQ